MRTAENSLEAKPKFALIIRIFLLFLASNYRAHHANNLDMDWEMNN